MHDMYTKEQDIRCWAKIQNIQIFKICGDQNITSDIEQKMLCGDKYSQDAGMPNAKSDFIYIQFYV